MRLSATDDVIVAPATPQGKSPIAVVRVSGSGSASVVRKIASFLPESLESHRIYYGEVKSFIDGSLVDEVLLSYFEKSRSYTFEESFEISTHGNPEIVSMLIQLLVQAGGRLALPGEFTYRAFLNGRIDLAEAEAVHSVISAESPAALKLAHRQRRGDLSESLEKLGHSIYGLLAQIEASIDFSTEGLEIWSNDEMLEKVRATMFDCSHLLSDYQRSHKFSEGIRVALIGAPNVGKSSLMNLLAGEDVSIVHSNAGTTRDIVSHGFELDGFKFHLQDTAGIRDTKDEVEAIGIERSNRAMREADLILGIFDLVEPASHEVLNEKMSVFSEVPWIIVANKLDKLGGPQMVKGLRRQLGLEGNYAGVEVSCLDRKSARAILHSCLRDFLGKVSANETPLLSNARHFEGLVKTESALGRAERGIPEKLSLELIAVDLMEAAQRVDEILGNKVDEAVIDRIFKDFCLGK